MLKEGHVLGQNTGSVAWPNMLTFDDVDFTRTRAVYF